VAGTGVDLEEYMKHKAAMSRSSRASKRSKVLFVIDANATLSPYAKYATALFKRGVQRAYNDLARKKVFTVVLKDGLTIRAIPRRVDGQFVVMAAKMPKKQTRAAS
jgi:hypothetical protein